MFKLANLIMSGIKFLGADPTPIEDWGWVNKTVSAINSILIPILSIVAAAGTVWAIVLGINMARADSQEKREEAKKRLVSLIVGIVVLVVLIVFFTTLFPLILEEVAGVEVLDVT